MKITLVFDGWRNKDHSELTDEQYEKVLMSQFHGGASFPGEIELDVEDETEFKEFTEDFDFSPVFWIMKRDDG